MRITPSRLFGAAKLVLALTVIGATTAVAAQPIFPDLPLDRLLFYSMGALLALVGCAMLLLVLSLTFRQYLLRKGASDTQWLWFDGEPRGLARLRRIVVQRGIEHH
ncbi:hypothetical protein [Chitinimonas sp.]|uniref:hypothetical protein n=1 Tax=Chitinimonas sp. TaxID=1934313 RepID=UPI002F95DFD1